MQQLQCDVLALSFSIQSVTPLKNYYRKNETLYQQYLWQGLCKVGSCGREGSGNIDISGGVTVKIASQDSSSIEVALVRSPSLSSWVVFLAALLFFFLQRGGLFLDQLNSPDILCRISTISNNASRERLRVKRNREHPPISITIMMPFSIMGVAQHSCIINEEPHPSSLLAIYAAEFIASAELQSWW